MTFRNACKVQFSEELPSNVFNENEKIIPLFLYILYIYGMREGGGEMRVLTQCEREHFACEPPGI